jgi:poly(3-hydroxybutyrate) depolymerase
MIQQLQSNLCIDSKQIYASGKSNIIAFLLTSLSQNLIRRLMYTVGWRIREPPCMHTINGTVVHCICPVSAALYAGANPEDCNAGRPVPIIHFHGLVDNMIPFYGQRGDRQNQTECMSLMSKAVILLLTISSRVDATPSITHYCETWAIRNGCEPVNCSDQPLSVLTNSSLPLITDR